MTQRTAVSNFRTLPAWTALRDGRTSEAPARTDRQASTYRTTVLRSIHDIDSAHWDELAGDDALARTHAYLAAVEASSINDCSFFYLLIHDDDDKLLAHACVYTITTDFAQLLPDPLQGLAARLRRIWPRFLLHKITDCALPLVAGHSISLRAGADHGSLILALESALSDIARAEQSSLVVIRDFLTSERACFDVLLNRGYNLVFNMPLARIRVRWKSHTEYLAAMRSRYRKDVTRRLKRASARGGEVEILPSFAEHADTLVEQSRVVQENSGGFKREVLAPAYYENMDRMLGERSRLLVIKRDGHLVAHGMVLTDRANLIATYFGRQAGPPRHEWFRLINEVIRLGIEHQCSYINLGRGSYDAKALVGADIEPLHVYARSSSALVNWLMRRIPNIMQQSVRPPKRIFREAKSGNNKLMPRAREFPHPAGQCD